MVLLYLSGTKGGNETEGQINKWVTKKGLGKDGTLLPHLLPHPALLLQGGLLPTKLTTPALLTQLTGYFIWEGRDMFEKSLEKTGCLRGASGSQVAWESCLRLQPAIFQEDVPSLDSGFPCLLGDAQYMRRCKSGQSEDFIYII